MAQNINDNTEQMFNGAKNVSDKALQLGNLIDAVHVDPEEEKDSADKNLFLPPLTAGIN
jgi:hypothetical protein